MPLSKYAEDGQWKVTSLKEKMEFYSTGATLASPEPKWDIIIKKFPQDFSKFVKNGRSWDWPRMRAEYAKHYPSITIDQVKHHKAKLGITVKSPRPLLEEPQLEEYPTDFSECHDGRFWDYDKIASLYNVPRDVALCHFKNVLNVTLKRPIIGTTYMKVPAHVLFGEGVLGEILYPKCQTRDKEALKLPKRKPSTLAEYLAARHDPEIVFYSMYEILGIAYDILE